MELKQDVMKGAKYGETYSHKKKRDLFSRLAKKPGGDSVKNTFEKFDGDQQGDCVINLVLEID